MRITNELKRNNQTTHPTMTARKLPDIDRVTYHGTERMSSGKSVFSKTLSIVGKSAREGFKYLTTEGFEFVRNAVKKKPAKLNNDDLQLFS